MTIELKINGEVRQTDNTGNMNYKIDQQIEYMERNGPVHFCEGDLLMSGTPEGIAPVVEGDELEASLIDPEGNTISQIR